MSLSSPSESYDLSAHLSELFKQKSTADNEVSARDSKEAKDMWSIYEGEANNVLVFDYLWTGLFSAVVTVFIVGSYEKVSPDPGITTTSLLSQILQQLTGFQNNTYPRRRP
ncbi:hypothetical protein BGY98DRAFT_1096390 [Russula aff. rugulosa BPL654]|nr:hypothetical protein BGY98DRAFT_1096390 [Russula aff. rugulosa BPL654]